MSVTQIEVCTDPGTEPIRVDELAATHLLTGRSATGKTTVLEALCEMSGWRAAVRGPQVRIVGEHAELGTVRVDRDRTGSVRTRNARAEEGGWRCALVLPEGPGIGAVGYVPEHQTGWLLECARAVDPRIGAIAMDEETCAIRIERGAERKSAASGGYAVKRVLAIATAIVQGTNGLVLVDQIEQGVHYTCLDAVWNVYEQMTEALHVQMVATTHSMECIEAAARRARRTIALTRLERRGQRIDAIRVDAQALQAVARRGIEMR